MKNKWSEAAVVMCLMGILSIPLFRPLFHEGLFDSHDSLSNLLRCSALFHELSENFRYVRWFKDFSFGHGYPFLNFYAPLTYYIMSFFHLLGLTFTASAKLLIIGQTLLRGFSMYLLSKQMFGKSESFLSGIAFIYAPYFICDIYVRGDFSEALSFSILPLAVLFFRSLMVTGEMKYLVYASITYSMLILSHNCLALPFSGIILAYILFLGFQRNSGDYIRSGVLFASRLPMALFAFILGIAMSTVFWLPAIAEMKYVHLARITEGKFFYANNFRGLKDLLSSRWGFGKNVYDPMPIGIGWPHIFAFLSSIWLILKAGGERGRKRRKERAKRLTVVFFVFLTLFGTFLITPFSKKLWEVLPLIGFLQFPWRMLAVSAFGTSFLFASFGLISGRKKNLFCGILLIIVIVFYGRYAKTYGYLSTTDSDLEPCKISAEDTITAYSDEYLPLWVKEKPSGENDCAVVSKGIGAISELSRVGADYSFCVSANESTEIVLNSYWYPGWRVWMDGKEIPISINSSDGRIRFSIAEGKHSILVRFLDTGLRKAAKLISLFSLGILIIVFCSRSFFAERR